MDGIEEKHTNALRVLGVIVLAVGWLDSPPGLLRDRQCLCFRGLPSHQPRIALESALRLSLSLHRLLRPPHTAGVECFG